MIYYVDFCEKIILAIFFFDLILKLFALRSAFFAAKNAYPEFLGGIFIGIYSISISINVHSV